jgi:hypothetical protein
MNFEEIYEMLENYYHGKYDDNEGMLLKFSDGTYLCADWPESNTLTLHVYTEDKLEDRFLNDAIVDFDTISPDGICNYMDFPEDMSTEEKVNEQVKFIAESIVDYMQENNLTCEPAIDMYDFDETDELEESVEDGIADLPRTTNFDKLYNETIGEFQPYKNTYEWYVITTKYYGPNGKRLIKFASDDLDECKANAGGRGDHISSRSNLEALGWDVNDANSWLEFFDEKAFLDKDPICQYCHKPMDKEKFEAQKRASEKPEDFVYNSGVCSACAEKLMAEYSGPGGNWTGD